MNKKYLRLEANVSHIRSAGRAIHGEEPQTCDRNVVELRVAVGKQRVAFLGSGEQRHRIFTTDAR